MKFIKLILVFLLIGFTASAQIGNDTTKYFTSKDYGWQWQRGKFRQLIAPTDTTNNKLGIAVRNNTWYIGNGINWTAATGSGGGGSTYFAALPLSIDIGNVISMPPADNNNDGYAAAVDVLRWNAMADSGIKYLAPMGNSPNAKGATFAANTLTIQPASASYGGAVSTIAQTYSGVKTFSSNIEVMNNYIGSRGHSTNTTFGSLAMANYTGNFSTGIGESALGAMVNGFQNVAIGYQAARLLDGGAFDNVAIGPYSMWSTTGGAGTVDNIAIGKLSLRFVTGAGNIGIGRHAGASTPTTGSDNLIIGRNQNVPDGTLSNQINIMGFLKRSSTGNWGFETSTANSTLQVNGTLSYNYVEKTDTYTAANDYTINCTANSFTVTLPAPATITGRVYVIKNTGTATTITLDVVGGALIDGAATQTITTPLPLKVQATTAGYIIIN